MTSVKPDLSPKVNNLESFSYKGHLTEDVTGSCFSLYSNYLNTRLKLGENEPIDNVSSLRLRGGGQSESRDKT